MQRSLVGSYMCISDRSNTMDADTWNARYASRPDLEWGAGPNAWVAAQMLGARPGRALDLGAGEGRNAIWLAQRGWSATAVDFAEAGLDKGRTLERAVAGIGTPPVTWVCADVTTYVPPVAGFDLVLLAYLHLPTGLRRTVVRHAAAALAPGGTLLIIGHDSSNLTDGIGGPQDPALLFTPRDILSDLHALPGLVVELADTIHRPVSTPAGSRDALDAVVRISRT
jgi:SAM-dependent methyltransferase